jgi:hypothetical protein
MRRMLDSRSFVEDTIQLTPLPERPEPERIKPTSLDKGSLLRRQGWTELELETAAGLPEPYRFPTASKRITPGSWRFTLHWRDVDVDAWAARVAEHVTLLQRLIQK